MKAHEQHQGKDWQEIHDRLARAGAGLEETSLTRERVQAILQERARKLAQVPDQAAPAADVMEVLIFGLGEESYAIETVYVREVLRFGEFTPLPGGLEHLIGISNVRGQILALFELGTFFEVKVSAGGQAKIIVLGEERSEFGIRADAVFEVRRLRNDEMLEAPQSVTPAARSILRGVTENALLVLDGAALLQDARLIIDGDSAAGFLEVPS